ncbi:hypothetical protein [Staphylococcus pseudintermedius]|uniref:hypothetical protein n=1 Tax=Staphylococcus pseudintermedius TaxID=283734 RepID=UPI002886BBBA|nr:hypothetical protein [Staphylococcus pseudintermedius]MDT0928488.1 hypothetical protein [Staphylococcus pseudintermedius]
MSEAPADEFTRILLLIEQNPVINALIRTDLGLQPSDPLVLQFGEGAEDVERLPRSLRIIYDTLVGEEGSSLGVELEQNLVDLAIDK